MLLLPDVTIISRFVLQHPFYYLLFFLLMGAGSTYYLRTIYRLETSKVSRTIYGLIILFALGHFLLISLILTTYQVIFLFRKGQLRSKENCRILLLTCLILISFTIGWIVYIQILAQVSSFKPITIGGTITKLYNYPKIFQKVIKPIIRYKIAYEAGISLLGICLIVFGRSDRMRKGLSFILIILLISYCTTGIAKTYYSHIRYFYYTYPLLLIFIGLLAVTIWDYVRNLNKISVSFFVCAVSALLILQFFVSWNKVVHTVPGAEKNFSYSKTYLDYKTCGNFLTQNKSPSDYVIAFASAQQSAVYCGTINACYRPNTIEYTGKKFHYITGSKFFDSKQDMISITEETQNAGNLWILINKNIFKTNSWEYQIIKKLKKYNECKAQDGVTSLAKLTPKNFLILLEK